MRKKPTTKQVLQEMHFLEKKEYCTEEEVKKYRKSMCLLVKTALSRFSRDRDVILAACKLFDMAEGSTN